MKNIIVILLFLAPLFSNAQKTHTVAAKESLYSLGRLYNVHPRELAAYNNISLEAGLEIGQVLKIPSKTTLAPVATVPTTTTQTAKPETAKPVEAKKVPAQGTEPVIHTVEAKEGLYGISKKYNVTIADIKKWNNLESDNLNIGEELIVGFTAATKRTSPVTPVKKEAVTVKAEEPKQAVKEPVKEPVKETPVVEKQVERKKTSTDLTGGYFKSSYNKQAAGKQTSEENGLVGIFKSTSGWEDGKYYCLHNSAPAGSFIKITNTANQKSVYAKVLDLIPDMKQSSGLIIRISNAAAAELGSENGEFDCVLQY